MTLYSRPLISGTYSLAFSSTYQTFSPSNVTTYGRYSYADGHIAINADANGYGFLRVEFGSVLVAQSLDIQTNAPAQVKTSQEMSDLFDELLAGRPQTNALFFTGYQDRTSNGLMLDYYFLPSTRVQYNCANSLISPTLFSSELLSGGGFDYSTNGTLFPFSFTRKRSRDFLATSKSYFDQAGSYYIGRVADELGSFAGDWQIQEFPFTYKNQGHFNYLATNYLSETLVVQECRAVFADGTTKILPFG